MAKDPAFLFYPGDYLRDTQCLSESVQVAYDRIMCEHMRNICITQRQLKFFTKRLTEDQKEELMLVLSKVSGGYCIEWVVESIVKRRTYSESRRKNRLGSKKDIPLKEEKDMLTYDSHMENENENEDINKSENEIKQELIFPFKTENFIQQWDNWKRYKEKEFKFKYKSIESEQAALKKLGNLSKNNESIAVEIIHQSFANGWKGLFKLNENDNGKKGFTERVGQYYDATDPNYKNL